MKLIKTINSVTVNKQFDGVYVAKLDHEIKSTTGSIMWTGPKIEPLEWFQVMSFFQWVYDTTKSEAQARMFINPKTKKWLLWAFPQEARTGMTAREIETDDKKEQRMNLPGAADLVPFGTVHHHCSCSAFQSSTDEHDEKNQEGLHITIGNMDKGRRDIHCRFYLPGGLCFEPDMSLLWDVGDQVRNLIPSSLLDGVARYQMTEKRIVDFPDKWKQNLVEVRTGNYRETTPMSYQGGLGYSHSGVGDWGGSSQWTQEREEEAIQSIVNETIELGFDLEDLSSAIQVVDGDALIQLMIQQSAMNRVEFDDVINRMCKDWKAVEDAYHNRMALYRDDKKDKTNKKDKKSKEKEKEKLTNPWAEKLTKEFHGADGFVGTHQIQGEPVHWSVHHGGWISEHGLMWDFGRKVWVDPDKETKHRTLNDKGEYWDSDQSRWVPA